MNSGKSPSLCISISASDRIAQFEVQTASKSMALRVQGSMFGSRFKVQGGDGSLNVEPVTLNRAEGVPSLLRLTPRLALAEWKIEPGSFAAK